MGKGRQMPKRADIGMTGKTAARPPLISRLVPLIVLAGAAAVIWGSGALDFISLQKLAEHRERLQSFVAENIVLAMAGYAVLYAAVVALSLPVAAPLTLAGGFLFGWLAGGLATVMAATLGAVLIFLLARGALAGPLSRMAGPRLDKLRQGFQENAMSYLLFLRLVPAFPFWLVNLAPALLGVPLRTYVIATFLGIIPGTFAFALTGAGLDSVLLAQQQAYKQCLAQNASSEACTFDLDPASLLTPELLLAFAALGVVALIPAIVKRVWKDKPGAE
jgi:uncharacterized membrane protein YdjX (TVP38/TMEM64 family)